jgi:hypothetical protein
MTGAFSLADRHSVKRETGQVNVKQTEIQLAAAIQPDVPPCQSITMLPSLESYLFERYYLKTREQLN